MARSGGGGSEISKKSQFEFVPRDTKKSEFLNLVDFGGVADYLRLILFDNHIRNFSGNCHLKKKDSRRDWGCA